MNPTIAPKDPIERKLTLIRSEIAEDYQDALKRAHSKDAIIEANKLAKNLGDKFTEFGKDKISAVAQRHFGSLFDQPVYAKNNAGTIISGILIGYIGSTASNLLGIVYRDDIDRLETARDIQIKGVVGRRSPYADLEVALGDAGYTDVSGGVLAGDLSGQYNYYELKSRDGYAGYMNIVNIRNANTGILDVYFFVGLQIRDAAFTKKFHARQARYDRVLDSSIQKLHQVLSDKIPPQIAVTPLIALKDFLTKYDVADVADIRKVIHYYASEMNLNNFTQGSVSSITSGAFLKKSPGDIKVVHGVKKAEEVESIQKAEQAAWVNFDQCKQTLLSFLCDNGYRAVEMGGVTFIFFDNLIYDALIHQIVMPAFDLKQAREKSPSLWKHKLLIGQMIEPPVFIDYNDRILLLADSYAGYTTASEELGQLNQARTPTQSRYQSEYTILASILQELSAIKTKYPNLKDPATLAKYLRFILEVPLIT